MSINYVFCHKTSFLGIPVPCSRTLSYCFCVYYLVFVFLWIKFLCSVFRTSFVENDAKQFFFPDCNNCKIQHSCELSYKILTALAFPCVAPRFYNCLCTSHNIELPENQTVARVAAAAGKTADSAISEFSLLPFCWHLCPCNLYIQM